MPPCVLLRLVYVTSKTSITNSWLSPTILYCYEEWKEGLQKFAAIQLVVVPPVVSEDGAGRRGAVRKSRRGEEATGMASPAADQRFFSVQLPLGFTSPSP